MGQNKYHKKHCQGSKISLRDIVGRTRQITFPHVTSLTENHLALFTLVLALSAAVQASESPAVNHTSKYRRLSLLTCCTHD